MIRPRHASAFTLVELLVVIAIIGVLVAMFLPALSRAREHGLRAKCLATNRALLVGVMAYQLDWRGYIPADNSLVGVQEVLVHCDYATQKAFTNAGCPYGPSVYSSWLGSYYYSHAGLNANANVGIGINWLLQSGYGVDTPYTGVYLNYGPFNDKDRRLKLRPEMIFVTSCCVMQDAGNIPLYHTLSSSDPGYFGAVTWEPRHLGEGVPMTFYDGHGRFVTTDEISPSWAWGAGYNTGFENFTMIEWSLRTKYHFAAFGGYNVD